MHWNVFNDCVMCGFSVVVVGVEGKSVCEYDSVEEFTGEPITNGTISQYEFCVCYEKS